MVCLAATSTIAAFKVLKSLVERWYASAQNEWSNELLCNFYRWLRTPAAKLYDPALFQMVHNMVRRRLSGRGGGGGWWRRVAGGGWWWVF